MADNSLSIFAKRQNNNIKLSSAEEEVEVVGTYTNFVNKIKGYVSLGTDEEAAVQEQPKGYWERFIFFIKNSFEVEKSYKLFFLMMAVGLALIFLSLIFLPMVLFTPTKFVSLFSLGSLVILISFVFIYGTSGYLEMLFSKQRLPFTLLFLFSIILGIYFAFIKAYFFISIICAVIQLVTLVIFTLSFIPGGKTGITFIFGMLSSPFSGILNRFKGQS